MMVAAVGAQYAGAAVVFAYTNRPWTALCYVGYTIGNIALTMIALGHK